MLDSKYVRNQIILCLVGLGIATVNTFIIFLLLATPVTAPVLVGVKMAGLFLSTAFFMVGCFLAIIGFGRATDPY